MPLAHFDAVFAECELASENSSCEFSSVSAKSHSELHRGRFSVASDRMMRSPAPSPRDCGYEDNFPARPEFGQKSKSPLKCWSSSQIQETREARIKEEKDRDDDQLMTTPTQPGSVGGTHSTCPSPPVNLPFLSRAYHPSTIEELHPYDNREWHIVPRIVEVIDDDRMSMQQESEDDTESTSTVITIRNLPSSPMSELGRGPRLEGGRIALERTAEYQRALFSMLEDMCKKAAKSYWEGATTQGKYCLARSSQHAGTYARSAMSDPGQYQRRRYDDSRSTSCVSPKGTRTRSPVFELPIRTQRSHSSDINQDIEVIHILLVIPLLLARVPMLTSSMDFMETRILEWPSTHPNHHLRIEDTARWKDSRDDQSNNQASWTSSLESPTISGAPNDLIG